MASHTVILFDEFLTPNYPDPIPGDPRAFYSAGLTYKYPFQARVFRAPAGAGAIIKFQGAQLAVNNCVFATRGPGGEQGQLLLTALSGEFYRVQLAQRQGASLAMSHDFTDGLLMLNLPTDALGNPAGTIDVAQAYIAAALSVDFVAVKSGVTNVGLLGATMFPRPCAREHWDDIVSTIGGLLPATVEHTIVPAAGDFLDVSLEIDARNYYAIRAVARSADEPDPTDRVTILATVEGA